MRRSNRLSLVTAGVLAAALALTGTARAAITGSSITTPADPAFSIFDDDTTDFTTISGTTTGATGSDKIDLRCYYAATWDTVRSGVALSPDGSFSTLVQLGGIDDRPCVLRALPANVFPADLTPFAGSRLGTGSRATETIAGGPNAGVPFNFHIWGQQLSAAFEYQSLGRCGLYAGHLYDATLKRTTDTFWCNAWFDRFDTPAATRSGLRIDGADAYPPWAADDITGIGAGLPAVTYSYAADPHTGDLRINASEPLVKCAASTYPPTAASCATFVRTGVTDTRTISQDHDGHLSQITDVFSSTDGAAHALDLEWENDQRFHGPTGDSTQLAYQFPGQTGFAKHAPGDVVALPAAPGTILIRMDGAPDGDPATGQGAIAYDRPADSATFIYADAFVQELVLHQTGTVPAGGSTTFRFAYAQDYTAAAVAALAKSAADAYGPPTVPGAGSGNGAVVQPPATPATAPKCIVPKVKGMTLTAAKKALLHAHCRAGKITRKRSKKIRKGRVISTSPSARTRHASGAKVNVTLSKGR
jgi:hypothetical protein